MIETPKACPWDDCMYPDCAKGTMCDDNLTGHEKEVGLNTSPPYTTVRTKVRYPMIDMFKADPVGRIFLYAWPTFLIAVGIGAFILALLERR